MFTGKGGKDLFQKVSFPPSPDPIPPYLQNFLFMKYGLFPKAQPIKTKGLGSVPLPSF